MMPIWAAPRRRATKRLEQSPGTARFWQQPETQEAKVADDREKLSTGPNERAINENIAGTGPGIPDDALAPDEQLPEQPSDEEVARIARALDAPIAQKSDDTLPLDGE
jgi:hypothetical protein